MRITSKEIAFLTLPTLIHAVSLADMAPRAENLPSACEDIYTSSIPGCTTTDFQYGQCTQSCFNALTALVEPINNACGGRGVTGQNLIVAFLLGVGPQQICKDADRWNGGGVAPFSSAMPSASGNPRSTTTEKKSTITSGTLTVSSAVSTDTSILFDTSKTPTTGALTSQTSSSGSSALPGQLNHNDHSGGGSPFDTVGNMSGAATLSFSAAITFLSAAAALFINFR